MHRELRAPQDVCRVRATPGDPGPRVGVVMNDMKVGLGILPSLGGSMKAGREHGHSGGHLILDLGRTGCTLGA